MQTSSSVLRQREVLEVRITQRRSQMSSLWSIAHARVIIIGLALASAMSAALAAAEKVTVVSAGGPYQAALRKAVFEPFAKATGTKLIEDEFSGEISKIKAMVNSRSVSWDVVDVLMGMAVQLCAQGLAERLDWKKLGIERSALMEGEKFDCGVPFLVSANVFAYDKDKIQNGPKTVGDF